MGYLRLAGGVDSSLQNPHGHERCGGPGMHREAVLALWAIIQSSSERQEACVVCHPVAVCVVHHSDSERAVCVWSIILVGRCTREVVCLKQAKIENLVNDGQG